MQTDISLLPSRLTRLRSEAGYSQMEFAALAGVTQAQISAYETGRAYPNLETCVKIAHALGITVQAFIDEKEPASAPPRPPTRAERAIFVLEAMAFTRPQIEGVKRVLRVE